MDLDSFKALFADSKDELSLSDATDIVAWLKENTFPMFSKTWRVNKDEYSRRLAQRAVCDNLIEEFESAPPWEDYREIFARLEWPYMQRALGHLFDETWYKGPYGKKRWEADGWFLNMWVAFHDVFNKMPGNLPDITPWRSYDCLMNLAREKL